MEFILANLGGDEGSLQLQNMCRMCGLKVDKAIPIFGQQGLQHELAIKIQTHLPIKISELDSLPQQLCYDCTSLLIQWDAALVGSLAADRKLRALQWKQQQAAQAKEMEKSRKEKSCNAANESLSCSVCNRSGMDFRQLILHLKNHEPPMPTVRENSLNTSVQNKDERDRNSISTGLPGPSTSPESKKKGKGKKDKGVSGSLLESNILETVQNVDDSVRSRLRKRKIKPSDASKDRGPEIGSGDPQVTSSTGTPPFKAADLLAIPDSSPVNSYLQALNACTYNGKGTEKTKAPTISGESSVEPTGEPIGGPLEEPLEEPSEEPLEEPSEEPLEEPPGETSQRIDQQLQDGFSKPKVRIISAENINLSLEQRAKANMNAKSSESDSVQNVSNAASSVSVLASSEKSLDSPFLNKNKIVISSEVMKQIGNARGKPGPKLLRLKDGRIVRLLDSAPTVSPLSNAYQRIYRPIQPTPLRDLGLPAKLQSRSVLLKTSAPLLPIISNVVSLPDKVVTDSASSKKSVPSTTDGKMPVPVHTMQSVASPTGIKTEPIEDAASSLPLANQRRMVNISFHPQPGPKNSVPRFTCFQCGKRNLLHDSLHAHAQMHAPDKAVLNAVSVPRSFSPVVASSIIRVVSSELRNQSTGIPAPESSKTGET